LKEYALSTYIGVIRYKMKSVFIIFVFSITFFSKSEGQLIAYINDPDGYTNIRKLPEAGSEILGRFEMGDEFYFFPSARENWWRVSAHSISGFMHKSRILPYDSKVKQISEFLKNFCDSDYNNAEISQGLNEKMFKNLLYYPTAFLEAFCNLNNTDKDFIEFHLKEPINDGIDLERIIENLSYSFSPCTDSERVVESIQIARKKYGTSIEPFVRFLNVPEWNNPTTNSLTINISKKEIAGHKMTYYLNNTEIDFISKLMVSGNFGLMDEELTFSVMDSIFTSDDLNRHYYFEIFKEISRKSDGALSEVIGGYYIELLRKYPCFFIDKINNEFNNGDIEMMIDFMAFEYHFEKDSEIKVKKDLEKVRIECETDTQKINEFQSMVLKAIENIER